MPMDSVVHSALEEICSQGGGGLSLLNLWPRLHQSLSAHGLPLCPKVKAALWSNLLNVPGLRFEVKGEAYDSPDALVKSIEKCEQMNMKIIASERLRRNFVGITDIEASDSKINDMHRQTLERLAIARTSGITQSELSKEFGLKGNDIFYILRMLECRGLILKQPTVVKTKKACDEGERKTILNVATNMLHLYRYGKQLGYQQRLEIIKENIPLFDSDVADATAANSAGFPKELVKEDVNVKDYLPALKAICDKLEQADGKVLVVSDLKQDLGYRGTSGHRAWRNICPRLKDAGVVEECFAKVKRKEVKCLRLLKKFTPKHFEPKLCGEDCDELDAEQTTKLGKRGGITDQLVELPIEHQIYDMIDAEGSRGLTSNEIRKRLGIPHKKYYDRILRMYSRFGMHLQGESCKKSQVYRFSTSHDVNSEASNVSPCDTAMVMHENTECIPQPVVWEADNSFIPTIQEVDLSTSKDVADDATVNGAEVCINSTANSEDNLMLLTLNNSQIPASEASGRVPNTELQIVHTNASNGTEHNISPPVSTRRRSYQKYPCLGLGAASALREQRILQLLKEEKFLIKAELHRRLEIENLEKEKSSMMDRRTLARSLNKLQKEGRCRCIPIHMPAISNCSASRTIEVVLHPSISNLSDEVVGQIQERHRLFEIQLRRQCYSRMKKGQSTPVLDSVQRIQTSVHSDTQAEQAEARRANGYVLAKMVRTKLLHIFLWNYLSGSYGWNDPLSIEKNGHNMRNPHSTRKMFGLDAAIKAMPLELFLQVVGSAQKFENLIEKCRVGLRLSDLPVEEYRSLMDTQATGRLSRLIDILLRLKLIRLVRAGHSDGEAKAQDITTLVHALELKPYIEEPVSVVASTCGFIFPDLRPHVRHDFVLSTRKAVDEYWNTLEYCYSAADSKAALHAFPGSAVHEIFFPRSWASARVMTVDQRAELLKRVVTDEPHKKLSYGECREIANDLNLTFEQVLRVHQDKRQKHFTGFGGDSYAQSNEFDPLRHTSSSSARKRKRSSKGKSPKHAKSETKDRFAQISDAERRDSFKTSLGDHGSHLLQEHINDQMQAVEEQESNEEHVHDQFFIHKYALSKLKTGRQNRFSWTEEAERQLVIEYVRNRALLGAKYHRTDWSSLSNLPAPPETCRRRMAMLNSTPQFRKAVLRLCNMLAERYGKFLEKYQNNSLNLDDGRPLVREAMMVGDCNENLFDCFEHDKELKSHKCWDNFDDCNIKIALDDILRYKKIAKSNTSKQVDSYEWSHGQDPFNTDKVCQEGQICGGRSKNSAQRSSSYRIAQKYNKLLNEGNTTSRRVYGSVAVSNAVELFKLIFLSTSITPRASILLAETLRRYSQHDLFAAFSYLREKKIMIGGNATSPFALSQHFLHSISLSPFPPNAGKRASKFASWLDKREKDLMEEEIHLPADLQCGDIFHLCALISLGELSITPCLPEDGVGEAEDSRTSKRKNDSSEYCGDKSKRLKTSMPGEGEIICRREKGFPGIRLSLSRVAVPRMCSLELFKDKDSVGFSLFCDKDQSNSPVLQSCSTLSPSDECTSPKEVKGNLGINHAAAAAHKSPWEAMTSYADHLASLFHNGEKSPFHVELFRTICSTIQKSGDLGLSMEEIANVLNIEGEKESEIVVDVLEAFGRAFKVNAYDAVHVVDSLYRSKYLLASIAESDQNPQVTPLVDSKGTSDGEHKLINVGNHEDDVGLQDEISIGTDHVHKITILNHPKELTEPLSVIQSSNEVENCTHSEVISDEVNPRGDMCKDRSCDSFVYPILPWINGDGTINELVYKGLVRRILGVVMQNPGILEDDIIKQMGALNPQSCRKLLEKLILDNHIIVRRMHQTTSPAPPAILHSLLGSCAKKSKLIYQEHLFANPMSTALL